MGATVLRRLGDLAMKTLLVLLLSAVLSAAASERPAPPAQPSPQAETPEEVYRAIYGEREKQVLASADRADDVAFGTALLDAVGETASAPKLQLLLCRKAYEFSSRAQEGYPTALAAAGRLRELDKSLDIEAREMTLNVREQQYRLASGQPKRDAGLRLMWTMLRLARRKLDADDAGEALSLYRRAYQIANYIGAKDPHKNLALAGIRKAAAREKLLRQLTGLQQAAENDPNNPEANRRLMEFYLIQMDRPKGAAERLGADEPDPILKAYIPLAAKDPDSLTAPACLELGEWYYQSLRPRAETDEAAGDLLLRAHAYYSRYLTLQEEDTPERARATLAMAGVRTQMEKLGISPDAAPGKTLKGRIYFLADDRGTLFVDGKQVAAAPSWQKVQEAEVEIGPESVIVAAYHNDGGPGGIAVAFVSEDKQTVFVSRFAKWKVLPGVPADAAGRLSAAQVLAAEQAAKEEPHRYAGQEAMRQKATRWPQGVSAGVSGPAVVATVLSEADFQPPRKAEEQQESGDRKQAPPNKTPARPRPRRIWRRPIRPGR